MNTHRDQPDQPDQSDRGREPQPQADTDPHAGPPSVAEVAALLRRLRLLTALGPDADPDDRARFLADKNALLARIAASDQPDDPPDEDGPDDGGTDDGPEAHR